MPKGLGGLWAIIAWLSIMVVESAAAGNLAEAVPVLKDKTGKVTCEIVVPDEAGPVAAFAGEELKDFLSRALSGTVDIRKTPSGRKTAIILGNNLLLEKEGIDVKKIPDEGFIIKSSGSDIFIAGTDDMEVCPRNEARDIKSEFHKGGLRYRRGTLFGVYEFLERFLGVRFYFPGEIGTIVPSEGAPTLPAAIDIVGKPDFAFRKIGAAGTVPGGEGEYDRFSLAFKHLNNLRLRAESQSIPNCHGLSRLDYIRRFGEIHPEYFALSRDGRRHNNPNAKHPGQLCFSSGIRKEIYQDAEAFLSVSPPPSGALDETLAKYNEAAKSRNIKRRDGEFGYAWLGFQPGYFNIMPQDGFYPCNCPACQHHLKGLSYNEINRKTTSNFMWGMICEVAEKLRKNGVPGHVTAMAYSPYLDVPDLDVPENVMVMVATRGPWDLPYPGYERSKDLIKAWRDKLGRKVSLWNYVSKHGALSMPGIPCPTPRYVGKYYQALSPYISGAHMSTAADRFMFQYLNDYIFCKIAWDNSANVEEILKEHHLKMFGPAAAPMEKAYGRFEENWVRKICGNPVETALGPSCAPPSDIVLWEKIYSEAEISEIESCFDEAEKLSEPTPEYHKRVRFIREHLFAPLKQAREKYETDKKTLGDLWIQAKPLANGETIRVDGTPDETAWSDVKKTFLRAFPESADKPTVIRTSVRTLRDDLKLYIAFDCEEPRMEKMVSSRKENDNKDILDNSSVEIFMNPSGDRENYRQIAINASGSIADLAGKKVGAGQELDWSWSSGAVAVTTARPDGWTMEIEIPFASLGTSRPESFPVNFTRNRVLNDAAREYFAWSPLLKRSFHEVEHFGEIRFSSSDEKNLLLNGDFTAEVKGRAFGGWHAIQEGDGDTVRWEIVSERFVRGGKSLALRGKKDGTVKVKQPIFGLKPNTEYLLTFFIRSENIVPTAPGDGGANVVVFAGETRYCFPKNRYTGTTLWRKQGFTFKTADKQDLSGSFIALSLRNAEGSVWFDDVRIREGRTNP